MKIEFRSNESSQLEDIPYLTLVRRYVNGIVALLPSLYCGLDKNDLDRLHITIMDGEEREGSSTTPHVSDPFRFRIKLVAENGVDLAEVIAHELCHFVQLLQGRLKELPGRRDALVWEGQIYDLPGRPYRKRPWEQEAMLNATLLHSKLLEH